MLVRLFGLETTKMKFGRNRPKSQGMRLSLRNYLMRSLPKPPPSVDYSPLAKAGLSQIYLNDQEGCCVISALGHAEDVWQGNSGGHPIIYTDAQINSVYGPVGGYIVGDPSTDNGCDEVTAWNYVIANGFAGGPKFTAWAAVNGADKTEVQVAIAEAENVMFGMELPDEWVSPSFPVAGAVLDVAGPPNPDNGHCMIGVGYNAEGVIACTWGILVLITWAAVAKYATTPLQGELYTLIGPASNILGANGKVPIGIDVTQLRADIDSFGGALTPAIAAA
jgi:hypothetical protein